MMLDALVEDELMDTGEHPQEEWFDASSATAGTIYPTPSAPHNSSESDSFVSVGTSETPLKVLGVGFYPGLSSKTGQCQLRELCLSLRKVPDQEYFGTGVAQVSGRFKAVSESTLEFLRFLGYVNNSSKVYLSSLSPGDTHGLSYEACLPAAAFGLDEIITGAFGKSEILYQGGEPTGFTVDIDPIGKLDEKRDAFPHLIYPTANGMRNGSSLSKVRIDRIAIKGQPDTLRLRLEGVNVPCGITTSVAEPHCILATCYPEMTGETWDAASFSKGVELLGFPPESIPNDADLYTLDEIRELYTLGRYVMLRAVEDYPDSYLAQLLADKYQDMVQLSNSSDFQPPFYPGAVEVDLSYAQMMERLDELASHDSTPVKPPIGKKPPKTAAPLRRTAPTPTTQPAREPPEQEFSLEKKKIKETPEYKLVAQHMTDSEFQSFREGVNQVAHAISTANLRSSDRGDAERKTAREVQRAVVMQALSLAAGLITKRPQADRIESFANRAVRAYANIIRIAPPGVTVTKVRKEILRQLRELEPEEAYARMKNYSGPDEHMNKQIKGSYIPKQSNASLAEKIINGRDEVMATFRSKGQKAVQQMTKNETPEDW